MIEAAGDVYLLVMTYGLSVAVSYNAMAILGQGAFVSMGAVTTFQLASHGVPLGVAVFVAVLGTTAVGALLGLAAQRLDGAPLALASWGLAWLTYSALTSFPTLSGGADGLTRASPAKLVSPALGVSVELRPGVHLAMAASIALLLVVAVHRYANGPLGLDAAAIRGGPDVAASVGVPVRRRRCEALAVAAGLGALGGAGTAILVGVVAPADYPPLLSLQLFVAVLIGGTATWFGPILGVATLAALPHLASALASLLSIDSAQAKAAITVVLLIVALVLRDRRIPLWRHSRPSPGDSLLPAASRRRNDPASRTELHKNSTVLPLRLDAVVASYSGFRALDGVSLEVAPGEVHALIGPNGSGKTTVLRVATGTLRAASGTVTVAGAAQRTSAPASRVRAGVVRTWQRTSILPSLRVSDHVAVGARAMDRRSLIGLRWLVMSPSSRRDASRREAAALAALDLVGLADRAEDRVEVLNVGEQRLLAIATAVATQAPAILLDEPAAGLSREHSDRLVDAVRALAVAGRGILLVEHDFAFVAEVADHVTVLVAGAVVSTGSPTAVRQSPAVQSAYLGVS